MKRKRYPAYMPSGTEWIGDIPDHWKVMPLKRIATTILGKMLTPDEKPGFVRLPYLRAQNIRWFVPDLTDVKDMWFSPDEAIRLKLQKGDLLVSEGGEVGRTCIWSSELDHCCVQNSVHIVRFIPDLCPRYFLYHFAATGNKGHFDAIVNRISIAHLTGEKLRDVKFLVPPEEEQQTIATYLDEKTTLIDDTIRKKQRLIELLQEECSALINQAVTRGLDPNVPMKSSGVDWLGEVPVHWEVKRLKHISPLVSVGLVINPSTYYDVNGTVPLLTGKNIRQFVIDPSTASKITEESNQALEKTQVHTGDIVTIRVGYPGVSAVVPPELSGINCASMVIIRHGNFNSQFLAYSLNSTVGETQVEQVQYGAAQKQFNVSHAIDFWFPMPPLKEQDQIVGYLEQLRKRTELTVKKIEREIILLQEYRTSLINEVVTGKRCVVPQSEAMTNV